MELESLGKVILVLGVGAIILGAILLIMSRVPVLKNFGKLPGDIHFQSGSVTCFAPIVSMCLLSLLATLILNVVARIFTK